METHAEETLAVSTITLGRSRDWVHHVISLQDAVDKAMKALLANSKLTFHRVAAKTIEIGLLRVRTERANCSRCVAMFNDDWIHVLIAHDNRQVAAFLAPDSLIPRDAAAGAIGFEVGTAHGSVRHLRAVVHSKFRASENCMEMVGTNVDMREHKRAEDESARLRMAHLARELEVRLAERTRIARELHDTLLQSFQALLLRFQTVSDLLLTRPAEATKILSSAIEQAASAITEGREAVQGLRTSVEEPNDLVAAIGTLGEELAADSATIRAASLRVDVEGAVRPLHPIVRDEIYRIAGEALRNAFQHSQGTQIEVELRYDKQQFRLRVRDDGQGIDTSVIAEGSREGHYGLRGMHERAELIGGELRVWSRLGAGTEVELTIVASHAYAKARHR